MTDMERHNHELINGIWEAARKLYCNYATVAASSDSDGHRIFHLVLQAMNDLIVKFEYDPLACVLAQTIINFTCDRRGVERQTLPKATLR